MLCTRDGTLHTADWRGGVARTRADGRQELCLATSNAADGPLRPNGIAIDRDGSYLVAHLGAELGGLYRLGRDGGLQAVLTAWQGRPLPPSNFVLRDRHDRIWLSVSYTWEGFPKRFVPGTETGFILRLDPGGPRLMAEGLGFANEFRIDPEGRFLYANETYARRVLRFPMRADGTLGPSEVIARFGEGVFPDGIELDAEGGVWITSIVTNQVIRLWQDASGRWSQEIVLEDAIAAAVQAVEVAWQAGTLTGETIRAARGRHLHNVTSLAFGGADLRTAYLGSLHADSIASFRTDVAGLEPSHWNQ